jgi:ribonuclease-3
VLGEFAHDIAQVRSPEFLRDYKSALQERAQSAGQARPEYVIADVAGPDHDKVFRVEVRVGATALGEGCGRTKKDAEQQAARQALDRWEDPPV